MKNKKFKRNDFLTCFKYFKGIDSGYFCYCEDLGFYVTFTTEEFNRDRVKEVHKHLEVITIK